MNTWSNIEISPQDPEIIKINHLEKTLGDLPVHVTQIRELITRFEACHFKYKQHFKIIKGSIRSLQTKITPGNIGANHIHTGENAWKNDKTGRSFLGQQYLWALHNWLGDNFQNRTPDNKTKKLDQQVTKWLGNKAPEKERLVRLLIARLTWDWTSLEQLQHGGKFEQLENQICRMDICFYSFPKNLDCLMQCIGRKTPVKEFEGCGTYNTAIKEHLGKEFSKLCAWLKTRAAKNNFPQAKDELTKVWLICCLSKTLKEQLGIKKSLPINGFNV